MLLSCKGRTPSDIYTYKKCGLDLYTAINIAIYTELVFHINFEVGSLFCQTTNRRLNFESLCLSPSDMPDKNKHLVQMGSWSTTDWTSTCFNAACNRYRCSRTKTLKFAPMQATRALYLSKMRPIQQKQQQLHRYCTTETSKNHMQIY